MELMIYILAALVGILVLGGGIIAAMVVKRFRKIEIESSQLRQENGRLQNTIRDYKENEKVAAERNETVQAKSTLVKDLDSRTAELRIEQYKLKVAIDQLKAKHEELIKGIEADEGKKAVLSDSIKDLEEWVSGHEKLREAIRAAEERSSRGWWIDAPQEDLEMCQLIEQISSEYPIIREDLLSIAWKRVWLPAMQDIGKEVSGKGGIYRLVMVDIEGNPMVNEWGVEICYVGQAVDFKERWYQHAKKMVGMVSKGREKLYKSITSPNEVRWEIVEELDRSAGADVFNERERFWIDFYGAELNIK